MMRYKRKSILIGTGNVGLLYDYNLKNKYYSHIKSIKKSNYFHLEAVFDISFKNFSKIKKKFNLELKHVSKINDYDFETAIISSSTNSHYKVFNLLIFNNNLKNLIIEKPCTYKYKEIKKIINVCKKKKINLFINYHRNFLSYFKKIQKILKNNGKSKIFINYNNGIYNNLSHFINFLIQIYGNPKSLIIFRKNKFDKNDINADLEIEFKNAIVFSYYNTLQKNSSCDIMVLGKYKYFTDDQFNQFNFYKSNSDLLSGKKIYSFKKNKILNKNLNKYQLEVYERINLLIKNKSKNIRELNNIALKTHEILEKIKKKQTYKRIYFN